MMAPPSNLAYVYPNSKYTINRSIANNTPSSSGGAITTYAIHPNLTAETGLSFSASTGVISGTATATLSAERVYTITGSNTAGSTTATVTITVAEGLSISPIYAVTPNTISGTHTFATVGGNGPFSYSALSGEGTLNSSTGVYTLPANRWRTTSTIQATDSSSPSNTSTATLYQIAARFNGVVNAIQIHDGYGYFGGAFTAYHLALMNGLGAVDATTGSLTSGCNLAGLLNSGATVNAIAETSTHLFVGGVISSYAGQAVQNLIKVHKATCALDTTFTKTRGVGSTVNALALSGDSLYLGGNFNNYRDDSGSGTQPAPKLAKVDLDSGNLDTIFTKTMGANNQVYALAVSGGALYVGGAFTTYRNDAGSITLTAKYLAKVDRVSGNLDTTFTQSTGAGGTVYALAISSGALYVGGNFDGYRNSTVQNLAKVDLSTGDLYTTFTKSW
jgi:hypothetical protein